MELSIARAIAEKLITDLIPYTEKIEVAGAVRRGNVRDMGSIDLVAISKVDMQPDVFMQMQPAGRDRLFRHIRNAYDVTQGGRDGQKQVMFNVCENIAVTVSLATPETWGYILALRTGPAGLSRALVIKLKKAGYEPEGGRLLKDRKMVPVPVEQTVFAMAGVRYVSPAMR
jgi:DNA polymerase/3'-5' exonuclease PolX